VEAVKTIFFWYQPEQQRADFQRILKSDGLAVSPKIRAAILTELPHDNCFDPSQAQTPTGGQLD
jgi:hypothetical protein